MPDHEQEKWLNHLSNIPGEIKIVPFDPTSQEKFERVKAFIQSELGRSVPVEHRGASSLGISGQDEIDIYIPVSPNQFESTVLSVIKLFGQPKSQYPMERTRFRASESGKKIDLFVINEESPGWINGLKFEKYLKTHPKSLEKYRELKEAGSGLSTQEYYRNKNEFINNILKNDLNQKSV